MNANRDVTKKELDKFYNDRHEERSTLHSRVIAMRLKVLPKLKEEEWESIVKMSKETVTAKNEMDKASKAVKLLNDFEVVHNTVIN